MSIIPPSRLRRHDLGELIGSASSGLILLPALLAAYRFAARANRKVFHDVVLLVIFGVDVDMVHIAFSGSPRIELVLGILEDGGEMLAVSLLLWYVLLPMMRLAYVRSYLVNLFIPLPASDPAERRTFSAPGIVAKAD